MAVRKITIPGQNVPIQIGNAVNPDWYDKFKFLELLGPLSDQDYTALLAQIATIYSPITRSFGQSISGSVTLVLTDAGKILIAAAAGAHNITVPPDSSVAFPVGTQIDIIQFGAGQPTFVAGSGVTIFSKSSWLKISAQYAAATLVKGSTNGWYLVGDLSP